MTTCTYVDSNCTILLQDFYCSLSKSDPNKSYDIWVHGLGMTKVYFQIGMIIGDTEENNKLLHNPIMPALINHFLVVTQKDYLVQLHSRFFINYYLEYLSTSKYILES